MVTIAGVASRIVEDSSKGHSDEVVVSGTTGVRLVSGSLAIGSDQLDSGSAVVSGSVLTGDDEVTTGGSEKVDCSSELEGLMMTGELVSVEDVEISRTGSRGGNSDSIGPWTGDDDVSYALGLGTYVSDSGTLGSSVEVVWVAASMLLVVGSGLGDGDNVDSSG